MSKRNLFGHKAHTVHGDAIVSNCPVNIELHIHIHSDDATTIQKIGRAISGVFGRRHKEITGAELLTQDDIQRRIIRTVSGK